MVRQIVRDQFFLAQKSEPATKADLWVGQDLKDTLAANRSRCVGMAANMIGIKKRVIIVSMGLVDILMYNPVLSAQSGYYEPFEGCLSLDGSRKAKRWQSIEVEYRDEAWKLQKKKLTGYAAQIVQHECDHLDGIVI